MMVVESAAISISLRIVNAVVPSFHVKLKSIGLAVEHLPLRLSSALGLRKQRHDFAPAVPKKSIEDAAVHVEPDGMSSLNFRNRPSPLTPQNRVREEGVTTDLYVMVWPL